jgi:hypothetical protein
MKNTAGRFHGGSRECAPGTNKTVSSEHSYEVAKTSSRLETLNLVRHVQMGGTKNEIDASSFKSSSSRSARRNTLSDLCDDLRHG